MTPSWTLKPVTFPIPPEIQVPHIQQRNGRFHRFPGIHENAPPQIDYDYDFSPRSIIFAPDDTCIARLVEPLNIVINKFSTSSSTSPSSLDVPGSPPKPNIFRETTDAKTTTNMSINKCSSASSSLSDTTITLGENKIIRCPEAITAMTFGPKTALKTYCSYNEETFNDNNQNDIGKISTVCAGYLLVTGHKNGNIRFWDTESGRLITTLSSHKAQVNALIFSPHNQKNSSIINKNNNNSILRLVSVASDLALKVWDCEIHGFNMSQSIRHSQPLWCCDYSANGRLVATAGTGKCIFIYDTGPPHGNMELRLRIQGHLSNIVGCKFSPDSALLVTASWDTKVNIWDSNSGELKRSLCHTVPPPQLVFSPHIRALSLNKFFSAISTVTTEGKLTIWNPLETHQQYTSEIGDDQPNQKRIENEIPELRIDVKDEGYLSCEFCNHGNLIAVADQCGYAYVYEVCMPVPKLSQFCRTVIQKNLVSGKNIVTNPVNEISCIPKSVKSYLSYESWT